MKLYGLIKRKNSPFYGQIGSFISACSKRNSDSYIFYFEDFFGPYSFFKDEIIISNNKEKLKKLKLLL